MSPRVSLPGADELFRATAPASEVGAPPPSAPPLQSGPTPADVPDRDQAAPGGSGASSGVRSVRRAPRRGGPDRSSSGRERHDEKITVYVSASELVDLEHARLTLRAEHGIAVDRGRIVREALAVVLADLEAKHGESILVRRLAGH